MTSVGSSSSRVHHPSQEHTAEREGAAERNRAHLEGEEVGVQDDA
eukprot:CAMPEP_0195112452 /NCGR_PEP_ID=MMETSP0448-20130528/99146_1 /TAXON_ID=66468 /ORGANISM="Heterocapsa triquestra, Strain CCMP 448" /LENGTH=44 /DNA_ID= /DNA_START= /DNA_END= /DNA_ORIENTATION=